ncbi:MAG: hypothetical protein OXC91_12505 [Rhodobacteraceae bacterium]|nr:hypothetical protein [Paracoccaceae bacterium]
MVEDDQKIQRKFSFTRFKEKSKTLLIVVQAGKLVSLVVENP